MAKRSTGVASASAFSKELQAIFNEIGAEATSAMQEAVTETAKEVKNDIQTNAKHEGWSSDYSNGFAIVNQKDSRFGMSAIIYHKAPGYRLVHLLEFGHRIKYAYGHGKETTSPPFPHIQPAISNLDEKLLNKFKEKLE